MLESKVSLSISNSIWGFLLVKEMSLVFLNYFTAHQHQRQLELPKLLQQLQRRFQHQQQLPRQHHH
jgi:hypothetical protein